MKKILIAAAALSCLQLAGAATAAPSMTFLAVPAADVVGNADTALVQSHQGTHMVVISKQPTSCGQRPVKPWFEQHGSTLTVGYVLPDGGQQAGARPCTAMGIFTFRGISDPATKVVAEVKRVPAVVERQALWVAPMPRMVFLATSAAAPAVSGQPGVRQSAANGSRIIVAKVPALCGDRPSAPSFEQRNGELHVNFEIASPAAASGGVCVATAVYTFHGLTAIGADPIVHVVPRRPAISRQSDHVAVVAAAKGTASSHGDTIVATDS